MSINRQVTGIDNDYVYFANTTTGVVSKVKLASDKQFVLLNKLRVQVGRKPLIVKPYAFKAGKQIDRILEKQKQQRLL